MRRTSLFVPLFALIAGIAGFFLRQTELNTVFDSVTGLAEKGAPVTISLIALSVFFAAASILLSVLITRTTKQNRNMSAPLRRPGCFISGHS